MKTFRQLTFRYADQVSVTDEILVEGNNKVNPEKVTNVSTLILEGNSNVC